MNEDLLCPTNDDFAMTGEFSWVSFAGRVRFSESRRAYLNAVMGAKKSRNYLRSPGPYEGASCLVKSYMCTTRRLTENKVPRIFSTIYGV